MCLDSDWFKQVPETENVFYMFLCFDVAKELDVFCRDRENINLETNHSINSLNLLELYQNTTLCV